MNNHQTPLMAIAMAGILAPSANAATILETADFSNNVASPTVMGAFNPAVDAIIGSVKSPDFNDFILLSGTPGATVSLKLSLYDPDTSPSLNFFIYDDPNFSGFLLSTYYFSPTADDTIVFTVPADGDYMVNLNNGEGVGGYNYTIGTVPEPGSGALLGAGLAAAALRRKRKGGPPEA
jgi:PEP-CTERM motif